MGKTLDGTSDSGAASVIVGDAGFRTLLGALSGMALLYAMPIVGQPMIESRFWILVPTGPSDDLRMDPARRPGRRGFLVRSIPP